jgi:PAS domain S-box-containing protein
MMFCEARVISGGVMVSFTGKSIKLPSHFCHNGCIQRFRTFLSWIGSLSFALLAAIILAAVSSPLQAQPERIVVAAGDSFIPGTFRNAEGDPDGMDIDLWKIWSEKTGVEVEIRLMDWNLVMPALVSGEVDAVDGVSLTPERAEYLAFTEPYGEIATYIFSHSDLVNIQGLKDLEGFPVGIVEGSHTVEMVKELAPHLRIVLYTNHEELVNEALRGRIRVFVSEDPLVSYYFAKSGRRVDFVRTKAALFKGDLRMAVLKENTELLELLNEGFAAITSEEQQGIVDRWTGVEVGTVIPWRWILGAAGGISIFLIILLGWNTSLRWRVRQATRTLQESEERLRSIFRMSPDVIIISRMEDGLIVNANDRFCSLSGFRIEEIKGRTTKELNIWENMEDREGWILELKKHGFVQNQEVKFRKKDGAWVTTSLSCSVVLLDGEPHLIAIARDITAQKKADEKIRASLAEKEILLKEIHHRIKSNLQSVMGLLDLQASISPDDRASKILKNSRSRILALALIHEDLYRAEDLSNIDYGKYIRTLTDHLLQGLVGEPEKVKVVTDIKDVTLNVDTAIPCGLIITELVSNSIAHGFPGARKGVVSISLIHRENDSFHLIVSDDGVGFEDDQDIGETNSMGLIIVKGLVEHLGGTMAIEGDHGTTITITFKEYFESGSQLH